MDVEKWLVLNDDRTYLTKLHAANDYTGQFGLKLSEEDAALLLTERKNILKKQERLEFGEGILPKLIFAFCDSPYIYQDNYTDTLGRLQEVFYLYKNETLDEIPDDELIEYMKEQFDGPCQGSVDYLEDTSLELFARNSRFGLHGSREEDDDEI
ncbi:MULTISPECIES: DUF6323 family protein [Lacrimispora]|uniref:DUF6323 family protein n=1 Tax=Lacrimispora TaxID=2719231 RepID=UPI000BE27604|nr:DUF6323 family protein [Lacrimispora amygdalina]MDK2968084.1 hypothetical protein [Lacrimispora sp.]